MMRFNAMAIDPRGNYRWEAQLRDGSIIDKGEDLSGCVRFSLIPEISGLPRHDFINVPMVRRFASCFHKISFGGRETLPGVVFWTDRERILKTSEDLTGFLKPGDYIGKGVAGDNYYMVVDVSVGNVTLLAPYSGHTKTKGMPARKFDGTKMNQPTIKYVHCLEMENCRIWINAESGAVLVTDKDYKLNL